jgi:glycosyltransferase involved in cell wall biosynthesis
MGGPKVVFGMAAYHRPDTLAEVLESLLAQTYRDFAVVIVDDRPQSEVAAIVDRYARHDPRITYEPNPLRLGMVGNWRKAFERSRALHPDSEYFAWASDHDCWHPRWLEVLVGVLDEHPEVVLAYPQIVRMFPKYRKLITRQFDTLGVTSPLARVRATTSGMITAGNSIYGLFRASALERAGIFQRVLRPDRLTLLQLALLGQFRQIPEYLWYREVAAAFSHKRQRQMLFAGRVPLYTYVPVQLQHFGVMVWYFCVQARGRPAFGRLKGLGYAVAQFGYSILRELTRDDSRWREALRHTALGRRLLPGGRVARDLRRRAGIAASGSR